MLKKVLILFVVALFYTCKQQLVHQSNFSHINVKESSYQDSSIKLVNFYKQQLEEETQKIIAYSVQDLKKENNQHALGNFVCDAIKYIGEKTIMDSCDIVLVNRGGLRANLPKGEIRVYNIFELMPFDNELVLLTVSGKKIIEGLNTIVVKRHSYLGLKLTIKANDEILDTKIGGKNIEENKNYKILTSDYIANGGDKFDFLMNPIEYKLCNIKIRDAIISYCIKLTEQQKQIIPYTDERFQISK
jgi:2',3'-cyclic-nucleotide 2'-phosphodiesterase (5'-nucleotidase family)